jgi:hypothetical protein
VKKSLDSYWFSLYIPVSNKGVILWKNGQHQKQLNLNK